MHLTTDQEVRGSSPFRFTFDCPVTSWKNSFYRVFYLLPAPCLYFPMVYGESQCCLKLNNPCCDEVPNDYIYRSIIKLFMQRNEKKTEGQKRYKVNVTGVKRGLANNQQEMARVCKD